MDAITQLHEAKQILHKVYLGQHVELVTEDGITVKYNPANVQQLEQYIARLEIQAGQQPSRRRRSVRLFT